MEKLLINLNKKVFRAYDVRGKYPLDIDENFAYTFGRSFGSYIKLDNRKKVIVGRDVRYSSLGLRNSLIKGLLESGVDVIDLGVVTTPMFYFAQILLDIRPGIMITASHNPKDDNGFKFSFDERGNARGEMIDDFYEYTSKLDFSSGSGKLFTFDVKKEYISYLLSSITLGSRKLRILFDTGNATCGVVLRDIVQKLNIEFAILYEEIDPSFPNHHPDPAVEENLERLKELVKNEKYDLGIAFDGDGDRIGIVDEKGNYLSADLLMIIAIRDLVNKLGDLRFSYDVKCTKALEDEILKLGGTPLCTRTGNSYGKAFVKDNSLPFGGELSGHLFFNDKFLGFDSAIYAALRFIEILSHTKLPFSELLSGINEYFQTPEIKLEVKEEEKIKLVEGIKNYVLKNNYKFSEIDGIKVLFSDGWALIRASNTGPHLTLRFEALTKARLEEIKDEFLRELKCLLV